MSATTGLARFLVFAGVALFVLWAVYWATDQPERLRVRVLVASAVSLWAGVLVVSFWDVSL